MWSLGLRSYTGTHVDFFNRKGDLLHIEEEKLDDLDSDFLVLKRDSELQRSVVTEEEDNIQTFENGSKH